MNDAAVEQDFRCIGDGIKFLQSLVKFVVVVGGQGCHPGLDFLRDLATAHQNHEPAVLTCFRDMTKSF